MKREIKLKIFIYFYVLIFPFSLFAIESETSIKDTVLKTNKIDNTKFFCLYTPRGPQVATKNKKGEFKKVSFLKANNKINKEKNSYKQKIKKEKNSLKKREYKKIYKKLNNANKQLEDCKTKDIKELACEIYELEKEKDAKENKVNQKIINGKSCDEKNSKVAKLYIYYSNGLVAKCSGTLITKDTILTAAHCLIPEDEDSTLYAVKVYIGGKNYYAVSYAHNLGFDNEKDLGKRDIGIVKLEKPLPYKPILLVSKKSSTKKEILGAVIGYGVSKIGTNYNLQENLNAGFAIIEDIKTNTVTSNFQDSSTQSGICFGDSGGPISIYENGKWKLLGVAHGTNNKDCGVGSSATSWWTRINTDDNIAFIESYLGDIYSKK